MTEAEPLLGVARSLTGRRWVGPDGARDRAAQALVQRAGVADPLARVLARLGVPPEAVDDHLSPTLRALLPDPRGLRDMDVACARLLAAVTQRDRIAVFADYDVDGGASAALLIVWLRAMGRTVRLYVPDRIDEGYGPNPTAMAALAQDNDLIVCVDCGTLGHAALAAARGADVVVLDHHQGAETLPPALAVVNPNRQDEDGGLGHLCAAGVVFLVLVEANRRLREGGQTGPDLMALLDLVALATVADVAPLVGVNRAFVRQGLAVMARRARPGLVALADVARLDRPPDAGHLGFVLGPRVNAGGRVGRADLGARLLACDDPAEAARLAADLDRLNDERRAIEAAARTEAQAQAQARIEATGGTPALAWAADEGWHPGIVGIVAARLKEATGLPAAVFAMSGDLATGSARSVAGVDIGVAVARLVSEGLAQRGGGHAMAAGLSVPRAGLPAAMARLEALLARQGAGQSGPPELALDGVLMPAAATPDLIAAIEAAGPFGAGAPAPRFAMPDMVVRDLRPVGAGHLRLRLGDGAGGRIEAIAFSADDGPLGPALRTHAGRRFHVAGRLEVNHWQGRQTVQLRLSDAAPANPDGLR